MLNRANVMNSKQIFQNFYFSKVMGDQTKKYSEKNLENKTPKRTVRVSELSRRPKVSFLFTLTFQRKTTVIAP